MMNELLKTLSARSWVQPTYIDCNGAVCDYSQDVWPRYWSEEKFAELIINECASVFPEGDGDDKGTYRDQIYDHFGVK